MTLFETFCNPTSVICSKYSVYSPRHEYQQWHITISVTMTYGIEELLQVTEADTCANEVLMPQKQ